MNAFVNAPVLSWGGTSATVSGYYGKRLGVLRSFCAVLSGFTALGYRFVYFFYAGCTDDTQDGEL